MLKKIVVDICFCFQRRYFYAFTDMGTRSFKWIDGNNWIAVSIFSSSSFLSSIVSSFLLLLLFFLVLVSASNDSVTDVLISSLSCNYWTCVSFSLFWGASIIDTVVVVTFVSAVSLLFQDWCLAALPASDSNSHSCKSAKFFSFVMT